MASKTSNTGTQVTYPTYRSPYGPSYKYRPHLAGWTPKDFIGLGWKAAGFGSVALFTLIFYASGIPRVQRDIMQKIPYIGSYYIKEIPPSDNPF